MSWSDDKKLLSETEVIDWKTMVHLGVTKPNEKKKIPCQKAQNSRKKNQPTKNHIE